MSYPPAYDCGNMNETKTRKRPGKLELLPAEMQAGIIEIAANSRLVDALEALKEHGVEVDISTLSRFIKKHQAKNIVKDGTEMKTEVDALAERGKDGKFREGTLEAVRQKLYEQVLESRTPEEALAMYAAMVKEETRLKELELEARKVAALEQQVKLQGLRIEVQARQGKGMRSAEVVGSAAVAELAEGEKGGVPTSSGGGRVEEERQRLEVVLREVEGIVNGAGYADDKVLAVRARLAEGRKL